MQVSAELVNINIGSGILISRVGSKVGKEQFIHYFCTAIIILSQKK